ncbi:hypothetical protein [Haloarchaeobius sp. FL176]|uniref:hypothetical protein n=1 Tax=Haloarchaeobius sp. FL176 TaxID=2967129 RepID=UPI0021472B99|nr:hypothetical protein [Haloarchaeobius sp. FL176]
MSTEEYYSDEDGRSSLLLRFVVWVLAVLLLGRVFDNNSLYDLRQLRAEQVVVRLGTLAVIGSFFFWTIFVARHDVVAIVFAASAGFIGMYTLPLVAVKLMTYATDRADYEEARNWERITEDRDFD